MAQLGDALLHHILKSKCVCMCLMFRPSWLVFPHDFLKHGIENVYLEMFTSVISSSGFSFSYTNKNMHLLESGTQACMLTEDNTLVSHVPDF